MLFIILLDFYNPVPHGGIFYGMYSGRDTLFNSDASIFIDVNLLQWRDYKFFIKYSSYLEMAEQKGKVILDPKYATYSIIGGIRYFNKLYWAYYFDHYCRHLIDIDLQRGKVVFNAEIFEVSNLERLSFNRDYYFSFRYMFYPQAIIVDWLNSRPYYRHRFIFDCKKNIYKGFFGGLNLEYTRSNDNPPITYYGIEPEIFYAVSRKSGELYLFMKYFYKIKDPLRSPEDLVFFGMGMIF
ncbi:hypothetical protein J7L85_01650 [candidate division WOR-3 bacterium]|nr:hypothetical protein [candidate division WOR-3 bacterium]